MWGVVVGGWGLSAALPAVAAAGFPRGVQVGWKGTPGLVSMRFTAIFFLLLRSNAAMGVSDLDQVDVLDELGSSFEVPPWIPTACPGSQPQMATGVFFRVCGLDSAI